MPSLKSNKIISWFSSPLAICIGLAVIVFIAFLPCLQHEFLFWDDAAYITHNTSIRSSSFSNIQNIFTSSVLKVYSPLTILSFAIEYYFFQLNPFVAHLNNVLLHIGVTLLVFSIARRLNFSLWASAVGSLLFGIHPMHVESVAWATERKDVLYSVFYLLSIRSYLIYLKSQKVSSYGFSFIFGLLSLLAKPMALSLPLILLLCDWFYAQRISVKSVLNKIPFVAYTIPLTLITLQANTKVVSFSTSFVDSILIWTWSGMFYLYKFFLPLKLCPVYLHPTPSMLHQAFFVIPLISCIALVIACILFRKQRVLIFAVLFYLLSIFFILRTNMLYDINKVADRFMYLPSLGLCLLMGYLVHIVWKKFHVKNEMFAKVWVKVIIVVFLILGKMTFQQTQIWRNNLTLANYCLAINPLASHMHAIKGIQLKHQKDYDQAMEHYNQAISIHRLLIKTYDQAIDPALPAFIAEAYNNRAVIYIIRGQLDAADQDLQAALKLKPNFAEAYYNLGNIAALNQNNVVAIQLYSKAIQFHPDYALAFGNRGLAYYHLREYVQALADFEQALVWEPKDAKTYFNRSLVYNALGEWGLAVKDMLRAKELGITDSDDYLEELKEKVGK